MAHLSAAELSHGKQIPTEVDTLVVGAGMAGLYCAWRILGNDAKADLLILDRSDRTGGRLDSDLVHFGHGETVKEEEGGMRFTFDLMDNLMSLLLVFGLDKDVVPFPMSGGGANRLCFRGRSFTKAQGADDNYAIWSSLYNLASAERGIDPGGMIDTVFNRILSANPQFRYEPGLRTPEFWQRFRLECRWNGVALKDWSLWNLFADMGYSNECITMLYGLAGFNGTFLSRMNAGEAYQLLEDFPAAPDFHTLRNGFSTLPNALVGAIGKEHIHLNTQVESIDEKTAGGYVVRYTSKNPGAHPMTGSIKARKIVLAMPRAPLETLFVRSNALNRLPGGGAEKLWNALQTTTNQALLKVNLYYDKAWWGNNLSGQTPVGYGPNFADLPTGSVYPFYSIDDEVFAALEYQAWLAQKGADAPDAVKRKLELIDNGKFDQPAALTIYCDFLNINFWRALQENGPLFDSEMQRRYASHRPQTLFASSQAVVRAATGFFKQLFNTNNVPAPVLTSTRIWDGSVEFGLPRSEQFDFGVHQWGLHADDSEVMPYLAEPLENLYVCGEAFSDYQGWVEGALRSANLVLAKGFNLRPISVVYQGEHKASPSAAMAAHYAKNAAVLIRKYVDPGFGETHENELAAVKRQRKSRPEARRHPR